MRIFCHGILVHTSMQRRRRDFPDGLTGILDHYLITARARPKEVFHAASLATHGYGREIRSNTAEKIRVLGKFKPCSVHINN